MTRHIVFISDMHENLSRLGLLPACDLLLLGGDFVTLKGDDEVRAAVDRIAEVFPSFIGVTGNMEPPTAVKVLEATGHLATLEEAMVQQGLRIRGISGGNKSPFNSPHEWEEETIAVRMAGIKPGDTDIFITHAPPLASGADRIGNGAFVGSAILAEKLKELQPKLWLCGHIHEAQGIYACGSTLVVNPGPFGTDGTYADILWRDGEAPTVCLRQA